MFFGGALFDDGVHLFLIIIVLLSSSLDVMYELPLLYRRVLVSDLSHAAAKQTDMSYDSVSCISDVKRRCLQVSRQPRRGESAMAQRHRPCEVQSECFRCNPQSHCIEDKKTSGAMNREV